MNTAFSAEPGQIARRTASTAHLAVPSQQEVLGRLVGTRAELEIRIGRALERIMQLHVEGHDAQAWAAAHALCEAMDATIDATTAL
jgi:hypothetical protein